MVADKEDRCGIFPLSWKNDSFHHACVLHDVLYVARKKGDVTYNRKEVDTIFKNQMLNIAGSNILLKAKAYLYYGIARVAGGFFWRRGHEKHSG